MWISRKKYEAEKSERESHYSSLSACLKAYQDEHDKLIAENKRLASLINEKTEECKIGPWCEQCKHKGTTYGDILDISEVPHSRWMALETKIYRSKITICLKHINEICPEFESKGGRGEDT